MNQDIDLKHLLPQLKEAARQALRYAGLMFFVLVAGIYMFVLFQINSLTKAEADPNAAPPPTTGSLRIDEKVAKQLEKLEDNSVNVQAIFREARENPFQE